MSDTNRGWTLKQESVRPRDLPLVGGKAVNLARLRGFGQPVPPWYALTTEAYRRVLEGGLARRIETRLKEVATADDARRAAIAGEIHEWIVAVELPGDLEQSVRQAHEEVIPDGSFVAVRSSATGEDTAAASFAGLHDSYLFIRSHDQLIEAVKKVWASAYTERALTYRLERGISLEGIEVAVLVQQMIDASVSGVMFTVNPNSGDVRELVISSLYGAGEGLVSVGLEADTFIVQKEDLQVQAEIARKSEQMMLDETLGAGLARAAVAEARREQSSLTDPQVRRLAEAGLAIERAYCRPQDIEFCMDKAGNLFLLQARPVTTVEEYGPAAGNRLIWDNSNIIESYSGVTSPMTFSFIRHAYTIVYHCFCSVMGVSPSLVHTNRRMFENMLGLFRGQVYYNINNWYRLIRLFPGYEFNKQYMESMMGVRESISDEAETVEPGWARRYLVELPALLQLVARSIRHFARIRKRVGDFERLFKKLYGKWTALDLDAMAPHELKALYGEMEERLLWNWKAPIINDFFVMIFYGTLKKLCVSWCGDEAGSLQNDLMCGEGGIESTEPTKLLLKMAAQADAEPELRDCFLNSTPDALAERIPVDPRFAEFAESVTHYLDLYGFRCVNELKLEEHSLKDRPAFLYQVIKNYLSMEDKSALDVRAAEAREQKIRKESEERAFSSLGWSLVPRRTIFRWVLGNARLGVKNRENLRFARTRIYGLFREVLHALGRQLADENLLDQRDDIFYLTLDEVWDFIQGTAVTTDLRGLAALRRSEFDRFRSDADKMPDDRFETYGMAYHRNRFRDRQRAPAQGAEGDLKGVGCCPGVVTAQVKFLRAPSEDASLAGEILVAERTDPGWVPLYPAVTGLLIERGSILSHSAIVAREMGIPTIVGIPGLTAALQTGQTVTMDGAAGTVRLHEGEVRAESRTE